MSNPNNNIIRPPVLNTTNPVVQGPSAQSGQSLPQTTAMLTNLVQNIIETQFQDLLQANSQGNSSFINFSDQTIDPAHVNNIADLDKIPDVVRCLRDFSGNPGEFNSWKKSVDRILQIYEPLRGTPKYYGILSVIRNKIIGNADIVLESYNTPLNWKAISKCLTMHYADKRDIRTLEYQMISLVQGNQTVQEFYGQVYSQLSLILNKIGCMDLTDEPLQLLTQTYRDKALDTFIRGLNGDLSRLLGMKEPVDLPQALHLCLKLENLNFRTDYAQRSRNISGGIFNHQSQKQKKNYPQKSFQTRQGFYPQLAYVARPHSNNNYRNYPAPSQNPYHNANNHGQTYFAPQRPMAPKPQPRPEPMEIDSSIRSKGINYMNRPKPNDFYGKRPPQVPFNAPANKVQRNFHLSAANYVPEEIYYQDYPPEESTRPEFEEVDYMQEYNQQISEDSAAIACQADPPVDVSDLHFLG